MNGQSATLGAPTSWQVAGVGDFNSDGKADIMFQYPSEGTTYIWDMNGAQVASGNPTSIQAGTGWSIENGKVA